MATRLIRLIAFVAVLLMPLGMAQAPAMPVTPAAAGHCDEHEEPAESPSMSSHCAACSALPGIDMPPVVAAVIPSGPVELVAPTPFHGIEPDTTTPPPKRS